MLEELIKIKTHDELYAYILKLRKRHLFFKPFIVKTLIYLYKYVDKTYRNYQKITKTDKHLIININCWGKHYGEKCLNFLLPSLLAEGNLPWLAKKEKVMLLFFCDSAFKKQFRSSAIAQKLAIYAQVNFIVIPNKLLTVYSQANISRCFGKTRAKVDLSHLKYMLLGAMQMLALHFALKTQSLISFIFPDNVVSDTYYKYAYESMKGKYAFMSTGLSVDFERAKDDLVKAYQKNGSLSISAKRLNRLQINCLHNQFRKRIVAEGTLNYSQTPYMLFKTSNGIIIRTFHYQPMLLDTSKIRQKVPLAYQPIDDHVFTKLLDPSTNPIDYITIGIDTLAASVCELSDPIPASTAETANYCTMDQILQHTILMLNTYPHFLHDPLPKLFFSQRFKIIDTENVENKNTDEDLVFFSQLDPLIKASS